AFNAASLTIDMRCSPIFLYSSVCSVMSLYVLPSKTSYMRCQSDKTDSAKGPGNFSVRKSTRTFSALCSSRSFRLLIRERSHKGSLRMIDAFLTNCSYQLIHGELNPSLEILFGPFGPRAGF